MYGDSISSRDAARKIAEQLINKSIFAVDFDHVRFISRSFAHEFITQLEKIDMEIHILNKNKEVDAIMALVQKSRQEGGISKTTSRIEVTDPSFIF